MRTALRLLLIAACLAPGASLAQAAQPAKPRIALVDRIVAVVNSEVITQAELQAKVRDALDQLRRRGTPPPPTDLLQRQVLERMITDRIQLQFAKDLQVRVDELDLDRTVSRIAESNKMTLAEFRQVFERDGVPFERFRDELRTEVVIQRLREREVDNRISVTESEIENYLVEQKGAKESTSEVRLAHILVRVPEQAGPEQIDRQRLRAEEVLKRLKEGGDFEQLAATYSDAPDGLKGGDMGWRSREHLPDLFAQAVDRMQNGELSGVLRSAAGFHVLKLMERRNTDSPLLVEQNLVRHILVRTNEVVSEDEAKRRLDALRERLVNGADFAELARVHSEDGTAVRGGDLGWVYPGDTVPEFERALRDLPLKQVSQPVKTPFGWHLIEVLERRTADASSDRKRLEARRALRERKSDESYQEWLRQLRDRAYVEYRLEER